MSRTGAIVGISDHGGWAVFVTIAADGSLLDRRRVELVDADLPAIPHHVDARTLPLERATALVARVRVSAERHAVRAFSDVAHAIGGDVARVALRRCRPLPPTLAERLADVRARNVADWVMYREVLAAAAEARDWTVRWFDAKTVYDDARRSLGVADFEAYARDVRPAVGTPWNADHRLALAGAIAARDRTR